jgi:hypothetical protein
MKAEYKKSSVKKFINVLCICLVLLLSENTFAQLDVKRDDFVGNDNRNWWWWYDDGPNTPTPAVSDGYVLFSLVDPVDDFEPFCDAAFWDGYPGFGGPYLYCTITVRAKALNPHKYGSRGWGLWYTEPWPNLQRQIWFMKTYDHPDSTGLNWWRAETANGRTEDAHHYTELDTIPIDDEQWHVYEIIRDTTFIEMKIDGATVLYTEEDLPTEKMAFHIWVDNLVYEHVEPDIINIYKREWTGKNDIVLEYVQIITQGQLDKSEPASGIKLLRQIPNEIYKQEAAGLWKDYEFSSPNGNLVILMTARVEQYLDSNNDPISDDDDIRFIIDGNDYGWNTSTSFDGDAQGTVSKSLIFEQSMGPGTKEIEVHGEISPLLYDVTVLGSTNGGIVFNQQYNETKLTGSDSLWKEIPFQTKGGEVAFYISGSADEDPSPSYFGYQYANFDDEQDDDMRIELDETDYGYRTDNSFYGNRLFGDPKSVLIVENLIAGEHTLRIFGQGTPTLYNVLIYGENDLVQSSINTNSVVPDKFELLQNYPNPFNGITKIEFSLPERAGIRLEILNALGEQVRILTDEIHNPGVYGYCWDGKNERGEVVVSGIYFYRVMSPNGLTMSKKLLFIK